LEQAGRQTKPMSEDTFFLEPVPPFRLDLTVWALRRHPDNAVDRWDRKIYRRIVLLSGIAVELAVEQVSPPEAPRLRVTVCGASLDTELKEAATRVLERLLGLRIDLGDFYSLASGDSSLRTLSRKFRGMKPPRFPTVFECVVNAIACQRTTLADGIRLLNRLAERCGPAIAAGGRAHGFPCPGDMVALGPEDPPPRKESRSGALQAMGFSGYQTRSILELVRSVVDRDMDLESIATLADEAAHARLAVR
jgi:DNA-3-methyladenine glycosylase II